MSPRSTTTSPISRYSRQLVAKPSSGLAGGAPIINAGRSEISGVEVDASVSPIDGLRFDLGYTYLKTEVKELIAPTLDATSPFQQIIPNGASAMS